MKIFVDANVVLDMLLKRKYYKNAQMIFSLTEERKIKSYLSTLSFAIITYQLSKEYNQKECVNILKYLYQTFSALPFSKQALENALYSNFKDIEDGYQYFTAKEYGIPIVVTRNVKDFVVDDISVLTPEQFLSMYRTN